MPDNAFYFHTAYAAAAVIYGAYAWSIWRRSRRMRQARVRRSTGGLQ